MSPSVDDTTVLIQPEAGHQPAEKDPAMPSISNTTLMFFAAGALVVFIVALVVLFG